MTDLSSHPAIMVERGALDLEAAAYACCLLRIQARTHAGDAKSAQSSAMQTVPLLRFVMDPAAPAVLLVSDGRSAPLPFAQHQVGETRVVVVDADRIASQLDAFYGAEAPAPAFPPASLIVGTIAPWTIASVDPAPWCGDRAAIGVAAASWRGGAWYDGPLWRRSAAGGITSYLPSGGDGALRLPCLPSAGLAGRPWSEAATLEGRPEERAHRCVVAQLRARLAHLPAGAGVAVRLAAFTPRSAVLLILLRQARYDLVLDLCPSAPAESLPLAWRRLCQNSGVIAKVGGPRPPQAVKATTLDLAAFADALDDVLVPGLAAQINRLSPLLPPDVLR